MIYLFICLFLLFSLFHALSHIHMVLAVATIKIDIFMAWAVPPHSCVLSEWWAWSWKRWGSLQGDRDSPCFSPSWYWCTCTCSSRIWWSPSHPPGYFNPWSFSSALSPSLVWLLPVARLVSFFFLFFTLYSATLFSFFLSFFATLSLLGR